MKVFLLSLTLFVASVAYAEEDVDVSLMQGLGDTRYHRIESALLDHSYHIFIRLPDGYDANSGVTYPTVYLLDGGLLYPMLSSYYQYLRSAEEVPDLIVVGISYGNNDHGGGNQRSRDYTAPSDERDYYGGAGNFQRFLEGELFPLIENTYRSNSNRRIVFGQSIAGQFPIYTALTDPLLFWGHIASNPAMHRNLSFFLENHSPALSQGGKLFVSSASNDDPRFRKPALEWMEHWEAETTKPFQLKTATLQGHSHFSAPPAAFRAGLAWLFLDQ